MVVELSGLLKCKRNSFIPSGPKMADMEQIGSLPLLQKIFAELDREPATYTEVVLFKFILDFNAQ